VAPGKWRAAGSKGMREWERDREWLPVFRASFDSGDLSPPLFCCYSGGWKNQGMELVSKRFIKAKAAKGKAAEKVGGVNGTKSVASNLRNAFAFGSDSGKSPLVTFHPSNTKARPTCLPLFSPSRLTHARNIVECVRGPKTCWHFARN